MKTRSGTSPPEMLRLPRSKATTRSQRPEGPDVFGLERRDGLDEPLTVADAREGHADADKTISVGIAERFQDQTVDEAADEAGPTDAEGQRHHRRPGEAGPLDKEPARLTEIVQHGLDLPPGAAWERLDVRARLPDPPVSVHAAPRGDGGGAPDVPDRVAASRTAPSRPR